MADPISVTSAFLTLVGFALQSSTTLYQTVRSFQASRRNIRELKEELESLTGVLQSLHEAAETTNTDFTALKLPLLRCSKACTEFEALVVKCTRHSGGSRSSVRDWATLKYKGDDITTFKNTLSGYKATIIIALGDANLRTAVVTNKVLNEYRELIENTTSDLQEHLEDIDRKLEFIQSQGQLNSPQGVAERQWIQEEKESTQQCLVICAKVSMHIENFRSNVFENISTSTNGHQGPVTTLGNLVSASLTTNHALKECKDTISEASNKLEMHLQTMENRLRNLRSGSPVVPDEQGTEEERIQEERDSTRQCLAICAQASEQANEDRTNIFEDVSMAEDGHQVIVSTIGDLILAKRVSAGARSTQWMGQMSDDSLQQLTKALGKSAMGNAANAEPKDPSGTELKLYSRKSAGTGATQW